MRRLKKPEESWISNGCNVQHTSQRAKEIARDQAKMRWSMSASWRTESRLANQLKQHAVQTRYWATTLDNAGICLLCGRILNTGWECDLTLCNWLNHSTCSASARCVATGQLFPTLRLTVPVKNSVYDDIVAHFNAFLIVAVPLPSTQQRNPSPRIVRSSYTSPSRPEASNRRLESALSPCPYKTPPPSPP